MLDLKSLMPWGHKSNVPARNEQNTDPFVSFRREMDSLFDDFFRGGFGRMPAPRFGEALRGFPQSVPALDVDDGETEMKVSAELPGVDEKDVEVTLNGDVLTIRGEKKDEREKKDGDRSYVERSFGSFSRAIRLPFEVGDEDVKADFSKGVLTIRIPKPKTVQAQAKRIDVKSS